MTDFSMAPAQSGLFLGSRARHPKRLGWTRVHETRDQSRRRLLHGLLTERRGGPLPFPVAPPSQSTPCRQRSPGHRRPSAQKRRSQEGSWGWCQGLLGKKLRYWPQARQFTSRCQRFGCLMKQSHFQILCLEARDAFANLINQPVFQTRSICQTPLLKCFEHVPGFARTSTFGVAKISFPLTAGVN